MQNHNTASGEHRRTSSNPASPPHTGSPVVRRRYARRRLPTFHALLGGPDATYHRRRTATRPLRRRATSSSRRSPRRDATDARTLGLREFSLPPTPAHLHRFSPPFSRRSPAARLAALLSPSRRVRTHSRILHTTSVLLDGVAVVGSILRLLAGCWSSEGTCWRWRRGGRSCGTSFHLCTICRSHVPGVEPRFLTTHTRSPFPSSHNFSAVLLPSVSVAAVHIAHVILLPSRHYPNTYQRLTLQPTTRSSSR
ncbi:hypothetical protein OH76DRAFT_275861 [Lentinus brumalis]|uniref:Uncharacterized protein n=1 Tax=Lentinus brumalis TaxID=2498619 RepID=A0A371CL23_9APHY|nr:hypothetical protein OH76DRAFT_275861 [Polyporus brumalis]